jgi:hypothetical protein
MTRWPSIMRACWSERFPVCRRRASRSCPLVLDVDDGEPQQLDDGVVGREVAAGLGDLAELVVQRLDRYPFHRAFPDGDLAGIDACGGAPDQDLPSPAEERGTCTTRRTSAGP